MVQTKAAANAFIDKLLTEDSTTRIAVVVFNLKVDQTGFYTWADKAELKTYINNIKKPPTNMTAARLRSLVSRPLAIC